MRKQKGFNPFKTGFVGSTDTHNTNPGDTEESDYQGAMGMLDDKAEKRYRRDKKRDPRSNRNVLYYNPRDLAAIWAKENTRGSLFDAMKTRELYATSGTRIALRMYAGWDLDGAMLNEEGQFSRSQLMPFLWVASCSEEMPVNFLNFSSGRQRTSTRPIFNVSKSLRVGLKTESEKNKSKISLAQMAWCPTR